MSTPQCALVGASPEMLVQRRGDGKSTIARSPARAAAGATPPTTRRWKRELRDSEKEQAEHLMLVDLGRNDVGPGGCARAACEVHELGGGRALRAGHAPGERHPRATGRRSRPRWTRCARASRRGP